MSTFIKYIATRTGVYRLKTYNLESTVVFSRESAGMSLLSDEQIARIFMRQKPVKSKSLDNVKLVFDKTLSQRGNTTLLENCITNQDCYVLSSNRKLFKNKSDNEKIVTINDLDSLVGKQEPVVADLSFIHHLLNEIKSELQ
jgi:hypothetical protein